MGGEEVDLMKNMDSNNINFDFPMSAAGDDEVNEGEAIAVALVQYLEKEFVNGPPVVADDNSTGTDKSSQGTKVRGRKACKSVEPAAVAPLLPQANINVGAEVRAIKA